MVIPILLVLLIFYCRYKYDQYFGVNTFLDEETVIYGPYERIDSQQANKGMVGSDIRVYQYMYIYSQFTYSSAAV